MLLFYMQNFKSIEFLYSCLHGTIIMNFGFSLKGNDIVLNF